MSTTMLGLVLAILHLLALGIGLAAVWTRARSLRGPAEDIDLRATFAADMWWAVAAAVWIVTGLWRLFAATEKTTGYYMTNHVFWTKMALLAVVIGLEIWPMLTLVRWRRAVKESPGGDIPGMATVARGIAAISYAQVALVVGMVVAAAAMARGFGAR
jgi:putative membrane protein